MANASEDMLSISAIAAKLADDVEGSNRSVALALIELPMARSSWWKVRWIIWKS